jgi:hypothetical protein
VSKKEAPKPKEAPEVKAVVEAAKAVVEAAPSNLDTNHEALRLAVLSLPEGD